MKKTNHRSGFTLVELMVAIALMMGIMLILTLAFQRGSETFRGLRSAAMLQQQLRNAEQVIRRDLAAEHFGGEFRPGLSGPYLRDQRLDLEGWSPPELGYFNIRHRSALVMNPPANAVGFVREGVDAEGIPSNRATDHSMCFTVRYTGVSRDEVMLAEADPSLVGRGVAGYQPVDSTNVYATRWAEIGYFMVQNGNNARGMPLFTLFRRTRALDMPGNTPLASVAFTAAAFPDLAIGPVSATNPTQTFMNPAHITLPTSRIDGGQGNFARLAAPRQGDDILLTDVLSFEILPTWTNNPVFNTVLAGSSPSAGDALSNPEWPFVALPPNVMSPVTGYSNARVFDTGSRLWTGASNIEWNRATNTSPGFLRSAQGNVPLRVRVTTIQIRLRIWDSKMERARQITIIQDI